MTCAVQLELDFTSPDVASAPSYRSELWFEPGDASAGDGPHIASVWELPGGKFRWRVTVQEGRAQELVTGHAVTWEQALACVQAFRPEVAA